MDWPVRIIGLGMEDPEQLLANPRNFRIHSMLQERAVVAVLEEVGWIAGVTVNQATGFVVDGHLRISAAIREGIRSVPVLYVELTPEEEDVVLATFDRLGTLAGFDRPKYDELVENIEGNRRRIIELIGKRPEPPAREPSIVCKRSIAERQERGCA